MYSVTKAKLDLKLQEEIIDRKDRYGKLFNEEDFIDGFRCSIKLLEKLIWHKKEEKSIKDRYIIISDGNGIMCDSRIERMNPHHRWAYLLDLLPELDPEIMPRGETDITKP